MVGLVAESGFGKVGKMILNLNLELLVGCKYGYWIVNVSYEDSTNERFKLHTKNLKFKFGIFIPNFPCPISLKFVKKI